MSMKGSDGVKAVGLVALIIVILGFTAFRLMGGKTEVKNAPVDVVTTNLKSGDDLQKVAATPHVTTGMAGPGENTQIPTAPSGGAVVARNQVNAPNHDPFKPPAGVRLPQDSGQTGPGSIGTAQRVVNGGGGGGALPKFDGGGTVGGIGPASVAAPQLPIELKGLIMGEPALAVISVGGEVSYKQQGDQVDGGLVLARISEAGIVLKAGKKNFVVAVGHTLKPATATALADEQLIPRKLPAAPTQTAESVDGVQKAESVDGPYDELLALQKEAKEARRIAQARVAALGGWYKYVPTAPAPSARTGHAKTAPAIRTASVVRHYRAVPHRKIRRRKHRRHSMRRKHGVKHSMSAGKGIHRHKHHRHRRHRRHKHHAASAAVHTTHAEVVHAASHSN